MSKLRYCNIKHINNILSINRTQNIGYILTGPGNCKNYSKGKDSCCKDIPQTEGRTVEPWPKTQMWPCNYPMEPQPPNYDPYKIRSPEVVVPPLPTSNAKLTGLVYASDQQHGQQDCHQPNPCCDAQNEEKELQEDCAQEQEGSRGFLASLKNFFGWGKKRKSEGDVSMIDETTCDVAPTGKLYNEKGYSNDMSIKSLFHQSHIVHPDNWKPKTLNRAHKLDNDLGREYAPRLGYHGRNKYKYAFHEPWNPLDRLTLLSQAERDESPEHNIPVCDSDKGAA